MKHNHTPGEWHTKEGQIYSLETGKTHGLIPYFDNTSEVDNANAKLMAAAPELLKALIEARDMMIATEMFNEKSIAFAGINNVIYKATN